MKQTLEGVLKYLRKNYCSYWIILGIDTAIAVLCTWIAYIGIYSMTGISVRTDVFAKIIGISFISSILGSYIFRTYRNTIRFSQLKELWRLMGSACLKAICMVIAIWIFIPQMGLSNSQRMIFVLFDGMLTFIAMAGFRIQLILIYEFLLNQMNKKNERILIYGKDDKSVALKKRMHTSKHYHVVGFVNSDKQLKSYSISELPVYYFEDEANFACFVKKYNINGLLFPSPETAHREAEGLVRYCQAHGVKNLVAPPIDVLGDGLKKTVIREIRIEDLLGREEIEINTKEIEANFAGKVVMVTGAAGSIGSELCRQLATLGVAHLVLFDNAETPMHELRLELERNFSSLKFTPFIGDVRQKERLQGAFEKFHPQVVFHAAAYKHVPLMEENPCEAVRVNVVGSRLVADFCVEYGVDMMVMISTDKAVNPTNVMGASKRLAEIYVQSLGLAMERGEIRGKTRFVTTRFGNVLGSNGSVIPYFRKQIEQGGPVTVTDPRITRFFMTISEACRLVMDAATMSTGNQIFIFDMGNPVKIVDLAERMIRLAGYTPNEDIKIKFIGLRPGEKLYEEVLSNEENTVPTGHDKIRVAKVREYKREEVLGAYDQLAELALAVKVEDSVRLMKQAVPEFKSRTSVYEKLDK